MCVGERGDFGACGGRETMNPMYGKRDIWVLQSTFPKIPQAPIYWLSQQDGRIAGRAVHGPSEPRVCKFMVTVTDHYTTKMSL